MIWLLTLLVFWAKGIISLDPDFGWHIRMGQLISSSGILIPEHDPFSYTMASFPFVDHEWLTNILMNFLYNHIGNIGLGLIFALLALIGLIISLKNKTNPIFRYALIFLSLATILPSSGIRPQVESWFFLSLLLLIWQKKLRYLIPILFLLWANLHGGFAVGLVTLTTIAATKSLRLKKINITDSLIVILSWLATLKNPYGFDLWGEVVMQLTDTNLRWTIQEWMPSLLVVNFGFIFLVCLSSILIFKYRKSYLWEELFIFAAFLLAAISSVRHIPLWVVVSLPLISKGFNTLEKEIRTIPKGTVRLQKTLLVTLIISIIISAIQILLIYKGRLNQNNFYPVKAISFLKNNLPEGNIFSDYGWGGYLIWQLPEKKVFIDGRMPSWRYNNCPPDEACNAMQDYLSIGSGKVDYQEFFTKYQINTVLISKAYEPNFIERIILRFQKESFKLTDKLIETGWQKVYEDNVSDILQK